MGIFGRRAPALSFFDAFTIYHEYCKVLAEAIRQLVEERGYTFDAAMMDTALDANELNWRRNNPTGYPYVMQAERWLDQHADGVKLAMWEQTLQHLKDGGTPESLEITPRAALMAAGIDWQK
jgi:crotonobetainyl-CoA:carnitine CoA-transferase CaiB-like acyl-CoA transferase